MTLYLGPWESFYREHWSLQQRYYKRMAGDSPKGSYGRMAALIAPAYGRMLGRLIARKCAQMIRSGFLSRRDSFNVLEVGPAEVGLQCMP